MAIFNLPYLPSPTLWDRPAIIVLSLRTDAMALICLRAHVPRVPGCFLAQSPDLLVVVWIWKASLSLCFLICKTRLIIPVSEGCIPFLITMGLLIAIACSELMTQMKGQGCPGAFYWVPPLI